MHSVISHNNFTFVDLRTHYDERLLRKFYNDFLVPNFSVIPDELDPIDVWIDALCDPNPRDVVGHVVLAFENLPTSRRAAPVTRKVSAGGLARNPVSNTEQDEPQAINSNETNNSESLLKPTRPLEENVLAEWALLDQWSADAASNTSSPQTQFYSLTFVLILALVARVFQNTWLIAPKSSETQMHASSVIFPVSMDSFWKRTSLL
jgi:hypothetical protein